MERQGRDEDQGEVQRGFVVSVFVSQWVFWSGRISERRSGRERESTAPGMHTSDHGPREK